jgi:hypothetical protein
MYTGKDETYHEILQELKSSLCEFKVESLNIITLNALIKLLEYLDEKETKRTQPTMD